MGNLALPGPAVYGVKYRGNSANHARNTIARSEKAQVTVSNSAGSPPASHSVFSFTDDVRAQTVNLELLAVGDSPLPGNIPITIPAPWGPSAALGLIGLMANALRAANFKCSNGLSGSLNGLTAMNARVSGNDPAGTVLLGGGPGFLSSSWRGYAPLVVGLVTLGGSPGLTLANDGSADRYDAVAGGLVRRRQYFW
jgi:hypothetical protein